VNHPVCTIIAGPNGAGKTTFALKYLPTLAGGTPFLNADRVASELSPDYPDRVAVVAGRKYISDIREFVDRRESFAFETTLSGRSNLRLVRKLVQEDWAVNLIYVWLPSAAACVRRVAERVRHGGHNIPREVILRRYSRSVRNLLGLYSPICTSVLCSDHSGLYPLSVFYEDRDGRIVLDAKRFEALQASAKR
jgi:predicted ABC-type ATPase